jgi:hypothetical protein
MRPRVAAWSPVCGEGGEHKTRMPRSELRVRATRFNRSSGRQTRRGSRRSIRFAKLVLERIAPFPTGVRIATFRRATPTRCGASWQAMNVGCCGSAPPTSVKRCGGRLPPMAQGSCRAIRLARLTLDPMTIERLTRRAPAAIINFFDTKDGWCNMVMTTKDLWLYQNREYIQAHEWLLEKSNALFDFFDWIRSTPKGREPVASQSAKCKATLAAVRELPKQLMAAHSVRGLC